MSRLLPALVLAGGVGLSLIAAPVSAQAPKPDAVRVRGDIVALSGSTLTVKSRDGANVDIKLADGWQVGGVAKADMADIKPGDFVGIASLPKADGGDGALEVLIFPPALKGTGEGSYGWDLKPNSSMTNATVANAVTQIAGRTVTLSYQGKEKTITISTGTPVVTFAPASTDDLTAGAVVFVPGTKDASGTITAGRVIVGKNGVVPPM